MFTTTMFYLKTLKTMADGVIALAKRVELLEKCDSYNTMYDEQADKRIKDLEDGETKGTYIMENMTKKIDELEENLRLIYEYLGVHKEIINDTFIVEDDECECCECHQDKVEKEFWEDVKELNNTNEVRYTAKEWLKKTKKWGEEFEGIKKKKK